MKQIKLSLRNQLLLAMSALIAGVIGCILIVVSHRDTQMMTDLTLEKYFLLTQRYTDLAANYLLGSQFSQEQLVILPLMQNPEVIYAFTTNVRGEIQATFDEKYSNSSDPEIVDQMFRQKNSLLEREVKLFQTESTATFIVQEIPLKETVSYEGQIRGKKGEFIFDVIQQLSKGRQFLGYLRIGFSQRPFLHEINMTRYSIIGTGLFFILVSLGLVVLIARQITDPLIFFAQEVSKIRKSDDIHVNIDQQLKEIHPENIKATTREMQALQEAFIRMKTFVIVSWADLMQANASMEVTKEELEKLNLNLESQVKERTLELQKSVNQSEQQNITLTASNRKLEDFNRNQEQLLAKLSTLQSSSLSSLKTHVEALNVENQKDFQESVRQIERDVHEIEEVLRPITTLYMAEKAIQSKRVLLAESVKKQQLIAKMALRGTGVELDIASSLEEGRTLLEKQQYDILCVDSPMVELARIASEKSPDTQSVFMTSEDASQYISTLLEFPFLANIVSRNDEDRTFTLKNILTTVSKLISHDLFGLEKYLSWGVDVQEFPIVDSQTRGDLVTQMADYLQHLGIRRTLTSKCVLIAEELLMNAVYDAPSDAAGNSLYNHLPRTEPLTLKPNEQGIFRYACDGLLLALSVEDPFGGFHRSTILKYLESCYMGEAGSLNKKKGGAGYGLFQIMETAELLVFNVKPGVKTEVIAMFNIDPNKPKSNPHTSFHYFYG